MKLSTQYKEYINKRRHEDQDQRRDLSEVIR